MQRFSLAQFLHFPDRQAVGALVFDPQGRLLMVHDRWRGEWSYPAGFVERGESSIQACVREIGEEVNLHLSAERFRSLGVHTLRRPLGRLKFTTYVAYVSTAEAAGLRLQVVELTDHRWVSRDQAAELISPRFKARLHELLTVSLPNQDH